MLLESFLSNIFIKVLAIETDPVVSIKHNDSVTGISFNSSGTLIATADLSGRIVVTQLSDLSKRAEVVF